MTQKFLCLCAVVALLIAFSTTNVANAQETAMPEPSAPVACPCDFGPTAIPCRAACFRTSWRGCPPVVTYRVGLFGHVRPVVKAPVYRSVPVCPPAPVFRAAYVPRLPVVYPCATPYMVPVRVMHAPYCW